MSTHYDVQALPAEQREHILRGFGLGWWRQLGQVAIILGVVLLACWYVGLLDATTLLNGLPRAKTPPSSTPTDKCLCYCRARVYLIRCSN